MIWEVFFHSVISILLFLAGIVCGYRLGYKDGNAPSNPSGKSSGS
jgi:hypothetical protein